MANFKTQNYFLLTCSTPWAFSVGVDSELGEVRQTSHFPWQSTVWPLKCSVADLNRAPETASLFCKSKREHTNFCCFQMIVWWPCHSAWLDLESDKGHICGCFQRSLTEEERPTLNADGTCHGLITLTESIEESILNMSRCLSLPPDYRCIVTSSPTLLLSYLELCSQPYPPHHGGLYPQTVNPNKLFIPTSLCHSHQKSDQHTRIVSGHGQGSSKSLLEVSSPCLM